MAGTVRPRRPPCIGWLAIGCSSMASGREARKSSFCTIITFDDGAAVRAFAGADHTAAVLRPPPCGCCAATTASHSTTASSPTTRPGQLTATATSPATASTPALPPARDKTFTVARAAGSWVFLAGTIVLGVAARLAWPCVATGETSAPAAGPAMVPAGVIAVDAARAARASPGRGGRARRAPSRPGQPARPAPRWGPAGQDAGLAGHGHGPRGQQRPPGCGCPGRLRPEAGAGTTPRRSRRPGRRAPCLRGQRPPRAARIPARRRPR
jgi:hypothetical protein